VNGIVQRFQCLKCGKTFSDRQAFETVRLERPKVVQMVKLFAEGMGVRAVARLTGCHTRTVMQVLVEIAPAFDRLHDKLVRNVKTDAVQVDELWARVGIRQSRITPGETERGDFYTFLGVAAREKLIFSYATGKRDGETTRVFVEDMAARIPGRIQVTSEGWDAYPALIREYMLGRLDYAVLIKQYGGTSDMPDRRRYSPDKLTGIHIKVKAGNPRRDRIGTSYVERANLTVRHFNKRFVRLGLGWSRKLENHKAAISVFVAAYNFCKVHSTLGCTPAMGAKLTDHRWTIEELIETATIR
jgi:IS1 family transposase